MNVFETLNNNFLLEEILKWYKIPITDVSAKILSADWLDFLTVTKRKVNACSVKLSNQKVEKKIIVCIFWYFFDLKMCLIEFLTLSIIPTAILSNDLLLEILFGGSINLRAKFLSEDNVRSIRGKWDLFVRAVFIPNMYRVATFGGT